MSDIASRGSRSRPRVLVSGYMLRLPLAGNVFAYFHYVLGLRRLGFEVAYVEESGGWPGSCYDPVTQMPGDNPERGLQIIRALFEEHGIADCPLCFVNRESGKTWGADRSEYLRIVSEADVLLNVGGICWLEEFASIPQRVLIDMDPLFTQVGGFGAKLLDRHHVHATYGINVGEAGCTIPTAGVDWIATVPPVVCDLWRTDLPPGADAPMTTIASWEAYGGVTHQGEHFGQKGEEFLKLIDVPRRMPLRFEIALAGGREVVPELEAHGWSIRDAGNVTASTDRYYDYVQQSYAEFSAAKNAYVKTRSGWFSDRSVCYLAAGRPVVVQETGFSDHVATGPGSGILTFSSADEAVARLQQLRENYDRCAAGAALSAETIFAHDVVLPRLMERARRSQKASTDAVRRTPANARKSAINGR